MIRKRHIKGEKHIALKDFAEYLRKSDVSENSKGYYGRFLRYADPTTSIWNREGGGKSIESLKKYPPPWMKKSLKSASPKTALES